MKTLKKILDFVDSYCKCQTDGKYGLDGANRAELKADIKKWAKKIVGKDNHVYMNDKQAYVNPMANYLTMDRIRNQLRKEQRERIKKA